MKLIKILSAGIMLSVSTTIFAAVPNIDGNWQCKGFDPVIKKDFVVTGEIKKTGDVYSLTNWKDSESEGKRSGTGMYNAKKDMFAVLFWSNDDAEKVGFGLYQIKSANKIVGKWVMKNEKITADETCERVKA